MTFLSFQGVTIAVNCTETDKHCWNRNPCGRMTLPSLPAHPLHSQGYWHSHQGSLTPNLLRKHSHLLPLSPDITPSDVTSPGVRREQQTPQSVLHKSLSLWLCPDQPAEPDTPLLILPQPRKVKNWDFSIFYLVVSSSSREGAYPPPWAFRQAHSRLIAHSNSSGLSTGAAACPQNKAAGWRGLSEKVLFIPGRRSSLTSSYFKDSLFTGNEIHLETNM